MLISNENKTKTVINLSSIQVCKPVHYKQLYLKTGNQ